MKMTRFLKVEQSFICCQGPDLTVTEWQESSRLEPASIYDSEEPVVGTLVLQLCLWMLLYKDRHTFSTLSTSCLLRSSPHS